MILTLKTRQMFNLFKRNISFVNNLQLVNKHFLSLPEEFRRWIYINGKHWSYILD